MNLHPPAKNLFTNVIFVLGLLLVIFSFYLLNAYFPGRAEYSAVELLSRVFVILLIFASAWLCNSAKSLSEVKLISVFLLLGISLFLAESNIFKNWLLPIWIVLLLTRAVFLFFDLKNWKALVVFGLSLASVATGYIIDLAIEHRVFQGFFPDLSEMMSTARSLEDLLEMAGFLGLMYALFLLCPRPVQGLAVASRDCLVMFVFVACMIAISSTLLQFQYNPRGLFLSFAVLLSLLSYVFLLLAIKYHLDRLFVDNIIHSEVVVAVAFVVFVMVPIFYRAPNPKVIALLLWIPAMVALHRFLLHRYKRGPEEKHNCASQVFLEDTPAHQVRFIVFAAIYWGVLLLLISYEKSFDNRLAKFVTLHKEFMLIEHISKYTLLSLILIATLGYFHTRDRARKKIALVFFLLGLIIYLSQADMMRRYVQNLAAMSLLIWIFILLYRARERRAMLFLLIGAVLLSSGLLVKFKQARPDFIVSLIPYPVTDFLFENSLLHKSIYSVRKRIFDLYGTAFLCFSAAVCFWRLLTAYITQYRRTFLLICLSTAFIASGNCFLSYRYQPIPLFQAGALLMSLLGVSGLFYAFTRNNGKAAISKHFTAQFLIFVLAFFAILPAIYARTYDAVSVMFWPFFVAGLVYSLDPKSQTSDCEASLHF